MPGHRRLFRLHGEVAEFASGEPLSLSCSSACRGPVPQTPTDVEFQIFFACLATFSTTGASAIGYAYAAEIPQQRLRAQTAGWALAFSNLIAIMFSFCTPLMINGTTTQWGVKTGFL